MGCHANIIVVDYDQDAAVLWQIADVIGQTEFGVVMDAEPVLIRVTLGCAGLEPGDSAESLIARARDNLA